MSTLFWFSYVVLWVLVAAMGLLIVLLYRQFGLTYMAASRRLAMQGPDLGAIAPPLTLIDSSGDPADIMDSNGQRRFQFIVFGAAACGACGLVADELAALPERWSDIDFVWVDRSDEEHVARSIDEVPGWARGFARSDDVREAWDVTAVPFSVLVSPSGEVVSKQLVNRRTEVEPLLESVLGAYGPKGGR
jgi:methylamine dehydrogenase accessory protein MauD